MWSLIGLNASANETLFHKFSSYTSVISWCVEVVPLIGMISKVKLLICLYMLNENCFVRLETYSMYLEGKYLVIIFCVIHDFFHGHHIRGYFWHIDTRVSDPVLLETKKKLSTIDGMQTIHIFFKSIQFLVFTFEVQDLTLGNNE